MGSLTYLQRKAEDAAALYQRSQRVIVAVDRLNLTLWESGRNLAFLLFFKKDQYREQLDETLAEIEQQIEKLGKLKIESAEQKKNIDSYRSEAMKSLEGIKEFEKQIVTEAPVEGRMLRNTIFYQLVRFKTHAQKILAQEEHRKMKYPTQEKQAKQLQEIFLVGGIGLNILICVGLAVFYSKGITSRLSRMVENTSLLEAGKPLQPVVAGSDEIAQLDHQFHRMADSLVNALRKEKAIFDNVAEVILTLDRDLRFSRVSPSVSDVLGWRPEDLDGSCLLDYLPEKDSEFQSALAAEAQAAETSAISKELQVRRIDSEYTWTRWTIIWSAQEQSYFCVMHDVSEQKHIEQLKQDFTNMISHDLRTPLTALSITLELLMSGMYGEVNEKGKDRLETSKANLQDLLRMISELLDIDKLQSGAFNLELMRYTSADLIADSVRLVSGLADYRSIEIEIIVDRDATLKVDRDLSVRVLQNLLSNALKFTKKNSTVRVYAGTLDDKAVFKVKDQGPGILLDEQKMIFDRYYQAKSGDAQTRKKGTGLGLAFCKAIVELHGGTIGVKSEKGDGCEFFFTLPLETGESR
ncbi:MAG: PAS domain-containing sensor histidine kinase [Cyanobacteria bacterium]|nr:PAS domain-containing sensor histidine kinase [Cyanobacteriota bacterium]